MVTMKITASGQLSLPADIRRRWNVERVRLVDHGDHVTLEPITDDAVTATFGMFAGDGPSSDDMRRAERRLAAQREERRSGGGLRRVSAGGDPAR